MLGWRRRHSNGRELRVSWLQAAVLGALVCGLGAGGVVLAQAGAPPPDAEGRRDDTGRLAVARLALSEPAPVLGARASDPTDRVTVIEGGGVLDTDSSGVARSDSSPRAAPVADGNEREGETPSADRALAAQTAPDAGAPPPIEPAPVEPTPIEPTPVDPVPVAEVEPPQACGLVSCSAGYTCCNASCGICVVDGQTCDPAQCQGSARYPVSTPCGQNTCSVGQACCNPTCGTCVSAGDSCDQTPCAPRIQAPVSMMCGQNTCSVGQVCCNPTCGTCVAEGDSCDETPCAPRIRYF